MPTALAHRSDPQTSHIAAESLNQSDVDRIKAIILDELAKKPQAAFQLSRRYFKFRAAFGWPDCKTDGIAKRLSELHKAHLVTDSGRTVQSPYKRPAVVWMVVTPPTEDAA